MKENAIRANGRIADIALSQAAGTAAWNAKPAGLDEDPPVRSVHVSFFTSDE
jgi:hypothetical protein